MTDRVEFLSKGSVVETDQLKSGRRRDEEVIDCDVHVAASGIGDDVISRFLPERWRRQLRTYGGTGSQGRYYPRAIPSGFRVDTWPKGGGPAGSDVELLQHQLLDLCQVRYAILAPGVLGSNRNLDQADALCTAANDWMIWKWLERDERLRASIAVSYLDPPAALREIERRADDPRFVQIYFEVRSTHPFGHRSYWPIYEAAESLGLPIGIHLGGPDAHPISGAGWPSYYLEEHVGMAQRFQTHLTSLVLEGVFERFPRLNVVIIEGGMSWIPPLAWRMDAALERLGSPGPELSRRPSEYIADNIWLTTQPIEEPPNPEHLEKVIEGFPSFEKRLMFATDYPHWDYDDPEYVFRKLRLGDGVEEQVRKSNAASLYNLDVA